MMHASQDSSLDGLGSSRDLGVLTTCRAFFMFLLRAHSYSERVARPMYQTKRVHLCDRLQNPLQRQIPVQKELDKLVS